MFLTIDPDTRPARARACSLPLRVYQPISVAPPVLRLLPRTGGPRVFTNFVGTRPRHGCERSHLNHVGRPHSQRYLGAWWVKVLAELRLVSQAVVQRLSSDASVLACCRRPACPPVKNRSRSRTRLRSLISTAASGSVPRSCRGTCPSAASAARARARPGGSSQPHQLDGHRSTAGCCSTPLLVHSIGAASARLPPNDLPAISSQYPVSHRGSSHFESSRLRTLTADP